MRFNEIANNGRAARQPTSHLHTIVIPLDPADWHQFKSLSEDTPGVTIIDVDDSSPGQLKVTVGCVSEAACDRL